MKKDTHILINDVIFRDSEAGVDFFTTSLLKSEKTEEHNGKKYFILDIEVSSASHPFYTGEDRVMDTAGRVEKFKKRAAKARK